MNIDIKLQYNRGNWIKTISAQERFFSQNGITDSFLNDQVDILINNLEAVRANSVENALPEAATETPSEESVSSTVEAVEAVEVATEVEEAAPAATEEVAVEVQSEDELDESPVDSEEEEA